ncbi:unnamed protein product [Lactuca saligna]|uniref:Uncharacterized protein n=1 Tax=Lactuca saligna TaxID=75948 RepID=A0AA35ZCP9_LACSI|nr:unnamed protein product [Lactuca saligna]
MIQDELSPTPSPSTQVVAAPQAESVPPHHHLLLLLFFIKPEMTEMSRAKADTLEPIVVANIPDVDAATNQPIPDTGDQSETDDYEGFLDLGFMQQAAIFSVPLSVNKIFNNNVERQHIVLNLYERIDRKKFGDVLTRRTKPNPIIRVRCTKPNNESLKLHLVRKKITYGYTKVVFVHELVKFSYSEWMQILEIINKHKSVHAQERKLEIQLLNKVKKLNLMCFQCTDDLPFAPTKDLFHLRLEGLGHYDLERGYYVLISLELNRRLDKLKLDQFRCLKPEILKEVDKFYNGSSDDSKEED